VGAKEVEMNEKEAFSKWCPMARIAGVRTTFNRFYEGNYLNIPDNAKCVGSGCMMWRWN